MFFRTLRLSRRDRNDAGILWRKRVAGACMPQFGLSYSPTISAGDSGSRVVCVGLVMNCR